MRILKAIWKLLVGVKDALVLLLMLLFFGGLYAILSARPSPTFGSGVLVMDLKGSVVEQPAAADPFSLMGGSSGPKEYSLRNLRLALLEARDDSRVKAVALDLDAFVGGGQTAMAELGEAIDAVRKSGKPVLAYATGYTDDSYQLAAHASEVWINPLGTVLLRGPGGNNLYFKGLLDKLGVTANVYRVGTYKAAVEPFIREDMSPEARQDAQALASSLFETWRDNVRMARPKAALDAYLRNPLAVAQAAGGDFAAAAQRAGLVDKVGERHAFEARLAQLGGADSKARGGFKRIKLDAYAAERLDASPDGPIGLVTVAGTIVDGKAPLGTAGGDSIAEAIDKAVRADKLKALVVRVDSPGGAVLASERIRQALLQAKAKDIPVVVSMGNVAASGGYWIATAGDFIMAEPSTVTGSIGVFGILPSFQGSLEKLGLGADGVKTTALSGEPDLLNGPSPEASQLVQMGVESIYRRFVGIVAHNRGRTPQQINQIAQGRVWAGGTARQIGLIDGFGGMDDAIAKAAQLAKLGDEREVTYLERPKSFTEQMAEFLRGEESDEGAAPDAFAGLAGSANRELFAAIMEARAVLNGPTLQVRCLECPPVVPVRVAAKELGLVERLLGWLS
ncbi:signal peptide peptidase SppA [Sphingomonas sp. GCM10030256]|uniref:signal peptide peptidase SppA n=1 Tax=Sphingomonas sp. GCM10030256 TaxID=3273427 RepID=UPI00360F834A